ncbi:MAG: type II toxin-antitoxin system death-on-curing family toxin [Promethearchaeota archaeon]
MIWIPSLPLIEILYEKQIGISVRYSHKEYLESALDFLKWGHPFLQNETSIWEKVSVLMRNIVQFHVFIDGCKRIGIHLSYIFLRKNGYLLNPQDPEEVFRFPMAVAKGDLSLKEIENWFKKHSFLMEK